MYNFSDSNSINKILTIKKKKKKQKEKEKA